MLIALKKGVSMFSSTQVQDCKEKAVYHHIVTPFGVDSVQGEICDPGFPLPRGNWPQGRGLQRYKVLHQPRLEQSFEKRSEEALVVDMGMGDGNALAELKREDNWLVGFSLHEAVRENLAKIDGVVMSPVPHGAGAQTAFEVLKERAGLVIDTYGPATYANNPVHAIIFEAMLLAPGGKGTLVISEIFDGDDEASPIGFARTRRRLKAFLKESLDIEVIITRTSIQSEVDASRRCLDFHVALERPIDTQAFAGSFEVYCQRADEAIGRPVAIPSKSATGDFDGGFSIKGYCYDPLALLYCAETVVDAIDGEFKEDVEQSFVEYRVRFSSLEGYDHFSEIFRERRADLIESDWHLSEECRAENILQLTYRIKNSVSVTPQVAFERARQDFINVGGPFFKCPDMNEAMKADRRYRFYGKAISKDDVERPQMALIKTY